MALPHKMLTNKNNKNFRYLNVEYGLKDSLELQKVGKQGMRFMAQVKTKILARGN